MGAAVVAAQGLYQAYGRQPALRGIDLTIGAGEAVALLGPNGAGKSTLLRILSTLERAQRGSVLLWGREPEEALRGAIGVVAHESHCYGDLTGRENLRFFAGLYGVADGAERADTLLEQVELVAAADRPARTYSRGMLQRLAVARALVHAPQLLLLDEPVTGLDRQGAALLTQLLAAQKARGASLLIVSHELGPIAPVVDRVVVLQRGRVVRDEALPPERALAALERAYDDAVLPPVTASSSVRGPGAA